MLVQDQLQNFINASASVLQLLLLVLHLEDLPARIVRKLLELELACWESMLHAGPCCFFQHAIQSSHVCCMASAGHNSLYLHVCACVCAFVSVCNLCVYVHVLEMCGQHCCCLFLLVLTTPYESFHCSYRLKLHLGDVKS